MIVSASLDQTVRVWDTTGNTSQIALDSSFKVNLMYFYAVVRALDTLHDLMNLMIFRCLCT